VGQIAEGHDQEEHFHSSAEADAFVLT